MSTLSPPRPADRLRRRPLGLVTRGGSAWKPQLLPSRVTVEGWAALAAPRVAAAVQAVGVSARERASERSGGVGGTCCKLARLNVEAESSLVAPRDESQRRAREREDRECRDEAEEASSSGTV